eukprot:EG_transcript_40441
MALRQTGNQAVCGPGRAGPPSLGWAGPLPLVAKLSWAGPGRLLGPKVCPGSYICNVCCGVAPSGWTAVLELGQATWVRRAAAIPPSKNFARAMIEGKAWVPTLKGPNLQIKVFGGHVQKANF